jgi:hypothetical protein
VPQPTPSDPRGRDRDLPRRTALVGVAAAAAAVTGGCTSGGGDRKDGAAASPRASVSPSVSRPPANPDVVLAARVLTAEQQMLARVTATVRRHRRLAPVLAGARSAHAAHVRLLARAVPPHASASATPASRPSVPVGRVAALRSVARAESALGTRHGREAVAAQSGAFARILASLAAASAQQAAHLTAVAAAGPDS